MVHDNRSSELAVQRDAYEGEQRFFTMRSCFLQSKKLKRLFDLHPSPKWLPKP